MSWRKDILESIKTKFAEITEFNDIEIYNEDYLDKLVDGTPMIAPFSVIYYKGFTSEFLGETIKREISVTCLLGVCSLRGEQAGFRGDGAYSGDATMEDLLGKVEDLFHGINIGTQFPVLVSDERYVGTSEEGLILFELDLVITGIFKNI